MPRNNEFGELFFIRWGQIRFEMFWGEEANLKVILKLYRVDGICEHFLVDTDPYEIRWNHHRRVTRDFFIHPAPMNHGKISCAKIAYIVHLRERSIASEFEYIFMDGNHFEKDGEERRTLSNRHATPNTYRTFEGDAALLQRDVDWYNGNPASANAIPKFTRGQPHHPFHPKRYVHDRIDNLIRLKRSDPGRHVSLKVCVDCISEGDFINHILYAQGCGVTVQCVVDWR
ncbi:MAG: hypothetical protein LLG06_06870, partial [Desulfobacteraceae bacterium]|nr:hypothetical protein [Desulfobacteraceae bacterium]